MSTETHLSQYGITMEQARSFIINNIDSQPEKIVEVCSQYSISNQMLADIYGGVTQEQVVSYFEGKGINSTMLDSPYGYISNLISPNEREGYLSNESLKELVIGQIGEETYNAYFNINEYEEMSDGIISTDDMHSLTATGYSATQENLESLFFGTLINKERALDDAENIELMHFSIENMHAYSLKVPEIVDQYNNLMASSYSSIQPDSFFTEDQNQQLAYHVASTGAFAASSYVNAFFTPPYDGEPIQLIATGFRLISVEDLA